MNLIPKKQTNYWLDPFQEMESLQKEMNRLFDFSLFRPVDQENRSLARIMRPAVDIFDNQKEIVVKADLPGLKKEEINVSVEDNILSIRAEKKEEKEIKKDKYYRTERFWGSFVRNLELPNNVDAQKIDANYKDGVLEIKLPKIEGEKPKQISVNIN